MTRAVLFLIALLASLPAAADMYQDARNAKLPEAAANLGIGAINVQAYGAVADARRLQCAVTSTAANPAITIAAPCGFTATDIGKPIVVWNAGSTATTPLATTIAAVADATHLTLTVAPGQTLAASVQYVSWGTDNQAAFAAAYAQAGKQANTSGQQGYVFFPPGNAEVAGAPVERFYGTTQAVGLAPNGYRTKTEGAGPYSSQILALAPIAGTVGLAFESAGYDDGNVVRDIGFDGNLLAQKVGYFKCSPNSRLDNARFATPAPGGIGLVIGEAGSSGCPGMVTTAVKVSGALNGPGRLPLKMVEINPTDTQHFGLIADNSQTAAGGIGIHVQAGAGNTVLWGPHLGAGVLGTTAIQLDAGIVRVYDPQIDAFSTVDGLGIKINANSIYIVGGRYTLPTAGSVGISIASGVTGAKITGFDCGRFSNVANCIVPNYPVGTSFQVHANGPSTIRPASTQVVTQNPAPTASTAACVMMGLGGTITPLTSGFVAILAQGWLANGTAGSGVEASLRYGTGAAPAYGAADTGSSPGSPTVATSGTAAQKLPFSVYATPNPLILGTAYWYDICVRAVTGGNASAGSVDIKAVEMSRY